MGWAARLCCPSQWYWRTGMCDAIEYDGELAGMGYTPHSHPHDRAAQRIRRDLCGSLYRVTSGEGSVDLLLAARAAVEEAGSPSLFLEDGVWSQTVLPPTGA